MTNIIEEGKQTLGLNKPWGATRRGKKRLNQVERQNPDSVELARDVPVGQVGRGIFRREVRGHRVRAQVKEGTGRVLRGDQIGPEVGRWGDRPPTPERYQAERTMAEFFLDLIGTTKVRDGFKTLVHLAKREEADRQELIQSREIAKSQRDQGVGMRGRLSQEPEVQKTGLLASLIGGDPWQSEIRIDGQGVSLYRPQAPKGQPTHIQASHAQIAGNYRFDVDPPRLLEIFGSLKKAVTGREPNPIIGRVVVEQVQSGEQIASVTVWRPRRKQERLSRAASIAAAAGMQVPDATVPVHAKGIVEKALQIEG
jgi:hypothetical protein